MSETRGNGADNSTITLADRLYPGGPIDGPGDGRQRELINEGVAKPAVSLFADERAAPRGNEQRAEPAFDPATVQGYEGVDPAILQDLGRTGISQRQATQLRPIYERAVQDDLQRYARSLEPNVERLQRELDPQDVQTVTELINNPELTSPTMKAWVLRWSGHEELTHMLVRWARAIRTGRY